MLESYLKLRRGPIRVIAVLSIQCLVTCAIDNASLHQPRNKNGDSNASVGSRGLAVVEEQLWSAFDDDTETWYPVMLS